MTRQELIEQGKSNEWTLFAKFNTELKKLFEELSKKGVIRKKLTENRWSAINIFKLTPLGIYKIDENYIEQSQHTNYDIYEVKINVDGDYYCDYNNFTLLKNIMYNSHFAGLQFEDQNNLDFWHMNISAIDKYGHIFDFCEVSDKPAKPVNIRIKRIT